MSPGHLDTEVSKEGDTEVNLEKSESQWEEDRWGPQHRREKSVASGWAGSRRSQTLLGEHPELALTLTLNLTLTWV